MNKIAKYVAGVFCVLISAYGGWLVITTTMPIEEWLRQNQEWRAILNLLVIIGIIGLLAGIVEAKRR